MTYLPHNICYRIMFILGFVGWVMIYLDYAATTPCDAVVLQEMLPYFSEIFGNPNSLHQFGMEAKDALDIARNRIAEAINSDFEEVIFTSGATESTNIAITRTMRSLQKSGKNRFLTLPTEHKATLTVANYLKNNGFDTEFLDVNREGILEIATLENALDEQVGMLSICHINNETGTMQDIRNIINICHKHNVLVHVDATQSLGKTQIDVKDLDIDFLSASGHKVYAPKGIGVLFCKKANMKYLRVPRANPEVEFGIRAGTVPVCLCVGMGKAVEIANKDIEKNWRHATKLRQIFIDKIKSQLDEIYINGSAKSNYPGIINMSFRGCEGEALMMEAKHIAVSSGSACTSNVLSISHVLDAMKVPADIAQSSLRITIGKDTTESDITVATDDLVLATKKLRNMSPVWDMIKAGIDIDSVFKR